MSNKNAGSFIATTNIWDVSELYTTQVTEPAFKELLVRLYQNVNNIAQALNNRDQGYYFLQEFENGQSLFQSPTAVNISPMRQIYRMVINFGALPNTGTTSVAHNIAPTSAFTFTRIYGAASDTTGLNYIPLPYASPTLANNIELNADATNVNIITGSNRTNFTITYVILEYVKS